MISKLLQNLLIFFLVLIFQVSILPNLGGLSETLNLVLVVIIFMAASYELYVGIIYAVVLGLSIEMYSALPYGLILLALLSTLMVINFISKRILTNKSFYSLVGQVIVATLLYSMILFVYKIIFSVGFSQIVSSVQGRGFLIVNDFFWRVVANVLAASVLFIVFHLSSRRFKTVYIDTTKA